MTIYDRQNFSYYVVKSIGYLLLFILCICKPEHEVISIFPCIYFMAFLHETLNLFVIYLGI